MDIHINPEQLHNKLAQDRLTDVEMLEGIYESYIFTHRDYMQRRTATHDLTAIDHQAFDRI